MVDWVGARLNAINDAYGIAADEEPFSPSGVLPFPSIDFYLVKRENWPAGLRVDSRRKWWRKNLKKKTKRNIFSIREKDFYTLPLRAPPGVQMEKGKW